MSQVPNVGDKQRLVGPGGGTPGGGPDPATTAPPEVRQASEIGVSLLYARGDHTHQSPTIYWPQTGAPNDNVVSNRAGWATRTTSANGGTNFCTYDPASASTGLQGSWGTISGGNENEVDETYGFVGGGDNNRARNYADAIVGGQSNLIGAGDPNEGYNFIGGGSKNEMSGARWCSVVAGRGNVILGTNTTDYSSILGGQNNVISSSWADARGNLALAYLDGQSSFASGSPDNNAGSHQYSKVVISSQLSTSDPLEWSNLSQVGTTNLNLLDEHAYTCIIEMVAAISGVAEYRSWSIMASVRKEAGVVTVVGYTTMAEIGTAATSTFVVEVTSSAGLLVVRFRTGTASPLIVNLCATLRMTEVISPGRLGRHHVHHASASNNLQGAEGSHGLHGAVPGAALHDTHRAVHGEDGPRPSGLPPVRHPQRGVPQERRGLPHRRGRQRREPFPGSRDPGADVRIGDAVDPRGEQLGELQVRHLLARPILRDRR